MKTTAAEYNQYSYLLDGVQPPATAVILPSNEEIYEIDLNTRTINAPEFLSVATDHYAETVYFKVDRFFDNMDLTKTVCVIQYINENAKNDLGEPAGGFAYLVPFYDVEYFRASGEDKILIPWCINGPATAAAGPVTFSIRFFLMADDGLNYLYNLNTQPATSQILHGMHIMTKENENFAWSDTQIDDLISRIAQIEKKSTLYWKVVE